MRVFYTYFWSFSSKLNGYMLFSAWKTKSMAAHTFIKKDAGGALVIL